MIYYYQFDRTAYRRMLDLVEKRKATNDWQTVYEIHGWDVNGLIDDDDDD